MAVVATGFFDGVHLGHRKVVEEVRSIAQKRGEEAVIVTFWPHPLVAIGKAPESLEILTPLEEKKRLLLEAGADRVEVVEFNRRLSELTAGEFVREWLVGRYGANVLVLGYDHRFGHDRFESVEDLAAAVRQCGLETVIVGEYRLDDGTLVSSSAIRDAMNRGDISLAEKMLGRKHIKKNIE